MQMPEPAGGTLDWQIEQYGPNGPLPHPGRGPFFCVRAAAGVRSISDETMGKIYGCAPQYLYCLLQGKRVRGSVVKKSQQRFTAQKLRIYAKKPRFCGRFGTFTHRSGETLHRVPAQIWLQHYFKNFLKEGFFGQILSP